MKTNNLVSPYITPHAAVPYEGRRMNIYGWDKLHFLVFIHLSFYLHFIEFHFYGWDRKRKEMLWHEEKWNKKQLQTQIDELGKLLLLFFYFFSIIFSFSSFLFPNLRLSSNLFPFFSAIFHTINNTMWTGEEEEKNAIKLHKSTAIACLFFY